VNSPWLVWRGWCVIVVSWCSPLLLVSKIEGSVIDSVVVFCVVVSCCMCFSSRSPSCGRLCPLRSSGVGLRRFSAGLFQLMSWWFLLNMSIDEVMFCCSWSNMFWRVWNFVCWWVSCCVFSSRSCWWVDNFFVSSVCCLVFCIRFVCWLVNCCWRFCMMVFLVVSSFWRLVIWFLVCSCVSVVACSFWLVVFRVCCMSWSWLCNWVVFWVVCRRLLCWLCSCFCSCCMMLFLMVRSSWSSSRWCVVSVVSFALCMSCVWCVLSWLWRFDMIVFLCVRSFWMVCSASLRFSFSSWSDVCRFFLSFSWSCVDWSCEFCVFIWFFRSVMCVSWRRSWWCLVSFWCVFLVNLVVRPSIFVWRCLCWCCRLVRIFCVSCCSRFFMVSWFWRSCCWVVSCCMVWFFSCWFSWWVVSCWLRWVICFSFWVSSFCRVVRCWVVSVSCVVFSVSCWCVWLRVVVVVFRFCSVFLNLFSRWVSFCVRSLRCVCVWCRLMRSVFDVVSCVCNWCIMLFRLVIWSVRCSKSLCCCWFCCCSFLICWFCCLMVCCCVWICFVLSLCCFFVSCVCLVSLVLASPSWVLSCWMVVFLVDSSSLSCLISIWRCFVGISFICGGVVGLSGIEGFFGWNVFLMGVVFGVGVVFFGEDMIRGSATVMVSPVVFPFV